MATLTAQMLIGREHRYGGGINPTNYLFLSENDRPALILVSQNVHPLRGIERSYRKVWIPTVDNMIEDAILMVAYYISQNNQIILALEGCNEWKDNSHFCLYDLPPETRSNLYEICKNLNPDSFPKVVLTVTKDSHFMSQLSLLDEYRINIEICVSISSKTIKISINDNPQQISCLDD